MEHFVQVLVVLPGLEQLQQAFVLRHAGGALVLVLGEALEAVLVVAVLAEEVEAGELQLMVAGRTP